VQEPGIREIITKLLMRGSDSRPNANEVLMEVKMVDGDFCARESVVSPRGRGRR
jgi:hypothetical protein